MAKKAKSNNKTGIIGYFCQNHKKVVPSNENLIEHSPKNMLNAISNSCFRFAIIPDCKYLNLL